MGVFLIIISESIFRPWQFPLPQKTVGSNSGSRIKGGSLYDGKTILTIEVVSKIGRPRILTGESPRSHERA